MTSKEELKAKLVKEAVEKAEKEAEERYEKMQEEEAVKNEVKEFLKGFPLIMGRKWWDGFDDGIHTYFYKTMGFSDTDGVGVRLAFFLLFDISRELVYVEHDTYSRHRNPSCGYIGQVLHASGGIQPSYEEEGNEHLLKYVYPVFLDMKPLQDECERMIKETGSWDDEKQCALQDVMNELLDVKNYKEEK